ncbi:MAG: hypothetical protein M3O32_03520 [Actinomycetota bacterium]|nr:hypothetical protein [Actinomycetota bacterium]
MDRLLTIDETAEALGTGERFVRRLIAEWRGGLKVLNVNVLAGTLGSSGRSVAGVSVRPWQQLFGSGPGRFDHAVVAGC